MAIHPGDFAPLLVVVGGEGDEVCTRLADALGGLEIAGTMLSGSLCGLPGRTIATILADDDGFVAQFDPTAGGLLVQMPSEQLTEILRRDFDDVHVDFEIEFDEGALSSAVAPLAGPGERAVLIHFHDDDDLYRVIANAQGINLAVQRVEDAFILSIASRLGEADGSATGILAEFAPDGRKQRALIIWEHWAYAGVLDIRGGEVRDWHMWEPQATVISPASKYRVDAAAEYESFVLSYQQIELEADFLDGWGGDAVVRRSVLRRESLNPADLLRALDLPAAVVDAAVRTLTHGPSPDARLYEPESMKRMFVRTMQEEREKPGFWAAFERGAHRLAWWWWLAQAAIIACVVGLLTLDLPGWVDVVLWIYLVLEVTEVIVRVLLWTRRTLEGSQTPG